MRSSSARALAAPISAWPTLWALATAISDIAPAAVFLASEAGAYVTGNTLHVDGGGHINGVPWDPNLPENPQEK